jgi:hypothetical protein
MKTMFQTAAFVVSTVVSLAAAHAQKAPPKLTVDSKLANPKTLPAVAGTTDTNASKLGFKCGGHLASKPVAILDVKAVTKLSVRAKGPGTLAVKIGNGGVCNETQTRSETAEILLDQWPAGIAEIYIGDVGSNKNLQATITVEDLSRPADLDWGQVARVSVDGPPATAQIGHTQTAGKSRSAAPRVVGCSATYRDQPDLVLEVTKAVSSLQVIARSIDAEEIMLIGPVTPDHRGLPVQCQGSSSKSSDGSFDVEPGVYGVKVGDKGRSTFVNIAVSAKGAKPESAKLAPIVPAKPALAERDLLLHYPHLTREALLRSDELRWAMFATAPPQLLAYVATDLSSSDGFFRYSGDSANAATWPGADAPALEYPKAGEPVLVIGGSVLTADGLVFGAAANNLAASAPGPLAIPSRHAIRRVVRAVGHGRWTGGRGGRSEARGGAEEVRRLLDQDRRTSR